MFSILKGVGCAVAGAGIFYVYALAKVEKEKSQQLDYAIDQIAEDRITIMKLQGEKETGA